MKHMHYLGVPTCPYCKKRVNLIRTWSLKRQGEYQCPRCGGISNIYLSPLVYVLALLAIFGGGSMYFFHKFVLDDISLETALYVFIPFAVFFFFSLFMVYLEKPVIKKVSKAEYEKKRRIRSAVENSAGTVPHPDPQQGYYEEDDYVPRNSHRAGLEDRQPGVVNQAAFSRAKLQAAVENTQQSQLPARPKRPAPQASAASPQRQPAPIRRPAAGNPQRIPQRPTPSQGSFAQQGAAIQQQMRAVNQVGLGQSGRIVGGSGVSSQNGAVQGRYPNHANVQHKPGEIDMGGQSGRKQ